MTKSRGIRNTSHNGSCSVDGCARKYYARDLCRLHWDRLNRAGRVTTLGVERGGSVAARLAHYSRTEGKCIVFTGYRNDDGYGELTIDGAFCLVHRLAWVEANGREIPAGLLVRHKCDNPPCINPAHLELGTDADNALDKVQRGRSLRGAANPAARLTEAQVAEIKTRLRAGQRNATIARAFGVGTSTISRIRRARSWGQA